MSKQEIEIEVPEKIVKRPAKTKIVYRFTCDVCGLYVDKSQDNQYGSGISACSTCKRDVCRTRGQYGHTCFVDHPEDHGDYPRKMCAICEPIYYKIISPMLKRHNDEEEQAEKQLKEESLKWQKD